MPKKLEDISFVTQDITSIIPGLPEPSLYVDFANEPLDMSPNNTTVSYENSVVSSQAPIGPENSRFNYASFDDASNANGIVQYDSADNPLAFTDGVSNYPFSICFWFNTRNPEGLEGLFSFQGLAQQRGAVTCRYQTGDLFHLYIYFTATANDYIRATINLSPLDPENDWIHVAITYDGTNTLGSGSNRSIKIYLNGSLIPDTVVSGPGYTGNPALKYADTLYLGAFNNGGNELDGSYTQFMWFSNTVLTETQINSIYNVNNLVTQENLKSGYLNNPTRTVIRDLDNRSSRYPTVHRMNRKGTSGILNNVQFKDDKTVKFGTRIKDKFNINDLSIFSKSVDSGLWETSDGMIIRREFDPKGDYTVTEGALVFEGDGDSEGRWIKTKNKVAKPTIWFNAIAGPYNNYDSVLGSLKLGLDQGAITDILKVQVSYDGSTGWTTVPIKSSYLSHSDAESLVLNDGLNPQGILFNANAQQQISLTSEQKKPLVYVQIPMEAFAELGYHDPFHVRFVQPSVSSTTRKVWAIGQIDIMSRNEQVLYPKLSKLLDEADRYFLSSSIANPNFAGALITTGSALPGITDDEIVFGNNQNEQKNTPFNESTVLNIENNDFYKEGTSEDIISGFSSPLLNKTKFEIDLSPSSETEIGLTTLFDVDEDRSSSPNKGYQIMSYWNNNLKKWEKIGKNIDLGINTYAPPESLSGILTGSNLGFISNLAADGEKDSSGNIIYQTKNAFGLVGSPTDAFCFPYGPQYHATGSQTIKAKDIGITKPFLLEKTSLKYDIKIELPCSGSDFFGSSYPTLANLDEIHSTLYSPVVINPNVGPSHLEAIYGLNNFIPTFFILQQKKSKLDFVKKVKRTLGVDYSIEEEERITIPVSTQITSGSNDLTYVDTVRSLASYSNTLFSFEYTNYTGVDKNSYINDLGVVVDKYVPVDLNFSNGLGGQVTSYTGSINVESDVKFFSNYPEIKTQWVNVDGFVKYLGLGKTSPGRSSDELSDNRSIVNNYSSFKVGSQKTVIPAEGSSAEPLRISTPDSKDLRRISPYIIFPEDDLVFGWQFPWSSDPRANYAGYANTAQFGLHKMTLFGNSKLTLFGSQVKDGKEFHEGLNQNLTSDAVHEVIGNEPVIDQWQIASRGEMSGSFYDQFLFSNYNSDNFNLQVAIGNFIVGDLNKDSNIKGNNKTYFNNYINSGMIPENRLNSIFSSYGSISDNITSLTSPTSFVKDFDNVTRPDNKPTGKFLTNIQRFTNIANYSLIFNDSLVDNIDISLFYGSLQNYTYFFDTNYKLKFGGSPKYYYDSSHYGFYSGNIRQGLDSNFSINILEGSARKKKFNPIGIDAPVKIQFVQEINDLEASLKFKSYERVKPSDVNGTSYQTFQSSNLSLVAISDSPFFDDGIVRNREYGEEEISISI